MCIISVKEVEAFDANGNVGIVLFIYYLLWKLKHLMPMANTDAKRRTQPK